MRIPAIALALRLGPVLALACLVGLGARAATGKDWRYTKVRTHKHARGVRSLALSADGKSLLSTGVKSKDVHWSPASGMSFRDMSPAGREQTCGTLEFGMDATAATFLGDGATEAAVLDRGGIVHLCDLRAGNIPKILPLLEAAEDATALTPSLAVAPQGDGHLAVGTGSLNAMEPDAPPGTKQYVVAHLFKDGKTLVIPAHKGCVAALAFTRFGYTLFGGGAEPGIRRWIMIGGVLAQTIGAEDTDKVRALACTRDGKRVAANGTKSRLIVWDVESGKIAWTLELPKRVVLTHLAFSPHGKRLYAAGTSLYAVWVIDAEKGAVLAKSKRIGRTCGGLAVGPEGDEVVVASGKNIFIWRPKT